MDEGFVRIDGEQNIADVSLHKRIDSPGREGARELPASCVTFNIHGVREEEGRRGKKKGEKKRILH